MSECLPDKSPFLKNDGYQIFSQSSNWAVLSLEGMLPRYGIAMASYII
jgi:hypothetical protein